MELGVKESNMEKVYLQHQKEKLEGEFGKLVLESNGQKKLKLIPIEISMIMHKFRIEKTKKNKKQKKHQKLKISKKNKCITQSKNQIEKLNKHKITLMLYKSTHNLLNKKESKQPHLKSIKNKFKMTQFLLKQPFKMNDSDTKFKIDFKFSEKFYCYKC